MERPGGGVNEAHRGFAEARRARRCARVALASGGLVAGLVILPAATAADPYPAAGGAGAPSTLGRAASAASAFCAKLPAAKVSSIVGANVTLFKATVEKHALECIYTGSEEIVVSKHPAIPAAELATRTRAEELLTSESPKHVKISFTSLSSVGPTAFSWTYVLNGGKLLGVSDNKGTTGYGVVIGGAPTLIGSKDLAGLERLLSLAMAA